jgi:hypothetical protein
VIGGKVLDASALAALVRGYQSMVAWISVAKSTGIVFYVPSLALTEVRAVRPDAGPALAELLGHSVVVLGELDAARRAGKTVGGLCGPHRLLSVRGRVSEAGVPAVEVGGQVVVEDPGADLE